MGHINEAKPTFCFVKLTWNVLRYYIIKSEKKLSGPFAERADPEIVQRERDNLQELMERRKFLGEQLEILR